MKTKYLITSSLALIIIGCIFTFKNISMSTVDAVNVVDTISAPDSDYNAEEPTISGKPVHIDIPALGVNLDILEGNYHPENNTWDLSKDRAHFATISTVSNNKQGNTFIYGHNNKNVFSSLFKLSKGDIATITTDNGRTFIYEYYSVQVTNPENASILSYEGPPILTLQTCSGSWYQNRSLFAFSLKEVI